MNRVDVALELLERLLRVIRREISRRRDGNVDRAAERAARADEEEPEHGPVYRDAGGGATARRGGPGSARAVRRGGGPLVLPGAQPPDLLHERGPAGFRAGISGTALYGAMTRGPRVIGPASRAEMKAILEEIRSGAFAREWAAEAARGSGRLGQEVERARRHSIEEARRRALGPGAGGPAP